MLIRITDQKITKLCVTNKGHREVTECQKSGRGGSSMIKGKTLKVGSRKEEGEEDHSLPFHATGQSRLSRRIDVIFSVDFLSSRSIIN